MLGLPLVTLGIMIALYMDVASQNPAAITGGNRDRGLGHPRHSACRFGEWQSHHSYKQCVIESPILVVNSDY